MSYNRLLMQGIQSDRDDSFRRDSMNQSDRQFGRQVGLQENQQMMDLANALFGMDIDTAGFNRDSQNQRIGQLFGAMQMAPQMQQSQIDTYTPTQLELQRAGAQADNLNAAARQDAQSGAQQEQQAMQAAASIAMIMMMCDRDLKENVEAIDADEILKKLETLDISKWNYKGDDQKHVGPMAQDFAERFGGPDRYIYVTDAFGVLTAALKALAGRVRELEAAQ